MSKLTVFDLLNGKGTRQFTYVQITSREQAAAAEAAGMDMIGTGYRHPHFDIPTAAPNTHFQFGLGYGDHADATEALRDAFRAMKDGADSIYCAMSPHVVEVLAREGVPVIAHVGLVPPKATWVGGLRAVGKTADQAVRVFQETKDFESAGAFGVEMEVVPHRVATMITRKTSILTISLGAGSGCDVQYLFSADLLGENRDHIPRHAKTYRNFAAEHDRLQTERIAAYGEFVADVKSGGFPQPEHVVDMKDDEFEKFLQLTGT